MRRTNGRNMMYRTAEQTAERATAPYYATGADSGVPHDSPIAVLVNSFPKLSEAFVVDEILALERLGQRMHVYALDRPDEASSDSTVARVRSPVSYLPTTSITGVCDYLWSHARLFAKGPIRYLNAFKMGLTCSGGMSAFIRAGWLAYRFQRSGIRHIHAHSMCDAADIAELGSHMGMSFSMVARADETLCSSPADLRRKLQRARFTVACSDHMRGVLTRLAPGAAIHRIYRGVDGDRFHPRLRDVPLRPALVLAVGALRHKKGFDTLIEACRILRDQRVRFRCDIVGCGPEHDALERRIDDAGLFGLVVLTGKLSRTALIERYAEATVLVQPSRIGPDGECDGIPHALLEAMAMQVPVVAARVAGIPEVVRDGDTGVLVPPEDPLALAQAVRRIIEDAPLRRHITKSARSAIVASFGADHNIRRLRQLLDESRTRSVQPVLFPSALDRRTSFDRMTSPAP